MLLMFTFRGTAINRNIRKHLHVKDIKMKGYQLPKIGFMPIFENLGDTFPLVEIAKNYKKLGGEAIFIGNEGEYEKLVRDIDYKIVRIKRNIPDKLANEIRRNGSYLVFPKDGQILDRYQYEDLRREKVYQNLFNKKHEQNINDKIKQEIIVLKKEKIELIVAAYNFTSLISARVTRIPLIILISGVAIPPYFISNYATFPSSYENYFTRLIPTSVKNRLTNWYILRCKWGVKGFNRFARRYNVPSVKRFLDLLYGDYILVADDINFLKLTPTSDLPLENYVGPFFPEGLFDDQDKMIDSKVELHLGKQEKSILLTMASSGTKKNFLEVLKVLSKTDYNVIAVYTTILNEDELPDVKDNILLIKFVPSIKKINEMVDLAIIHGGRGTVYTAAYSGKPAIGIPMHAEQQHNLDNLVRHGTAIRLSKKYFNEKKLLNAIQEIFDNYDKYLKNAKLLKKKLPEPKGAENATKKILEIAATELNKHNK